jgi:hypothetical protein
MSDILTTVIFGFAGIGVGVAIVLLVMWASLSLKYPKINTRAMTADWQAHEPEYIRLLRDPKSTASDVREFENAFERKWFK